MVSGQLEVKSRGGYEETNTTEVKSSGKCFLGVTTHTEPWSRRRQRCISSWQPMLAMCKSLPCVTGVGSRGGVGLKGSWRTAESTWPCERPGAATGECVVSVAVESPRLKESGEPGERLRLGAT